MHKVDGVYLLDRWDYEQMGLEDLRAQNAALRMKVASVSGYVAQAQRDRDQMQDKMYESYREANRAHEKRREWEEQCYELEQECERKERLLDKHRKRLHKLTAQVKALKAAAAEAPATTDAQGT